MPNKIIAELEIIQVGGTPSTGTPPVLTVENDIHDSRRVILRWPKGKPLMVYKAELLRAIGG